MSSDQDKTISIIELFNRARAIIEEVKHVQKTLYQLAFVATSDNPKAKEAEELINELVKRGLISESEARKALNDVVRWRSRILDKEVL